MMPTAGPTVTLEARRNEFGCRPTKVVMQAGEQTVNLVLRDLSRVSGKVLALDESPLPSVIVQAIGQEDFEFRVKMDAGFKGEYYQWDSPLTDLPADTTGRQPT